MISKRHTKGTTGVFITKEFLSQAGITEADIEIALSNKEIWIYPTKSARRKNFTFDLLCGSALDLPK